MAVDVVSIEAYSDWKLEHEIVRRLAVQNPKVYTEQEAFEKLGITPEEVALAEEFEI